MIKQWGALAFRGAGRILGLARGRLKHAHIHQGGVCKPVPARAPPRRHAQRVHQRGASPAAAAAGGRRGARAGGRSRGRAGMVVAHCGTRDALASSEPAVSAGQDRRAAVSAQDHVPRGDSTSMAAVYSDNRPGLSSTAHLSCRVSIGPAQLCTSASRHASISCPSQGHMLLEPLPP